MTDVLFKSTSYFTASQYRNNNGGSLTEENGQWVVKKETGASSLQVESIVHSFNSGRITERAANKLLASIGAKPLNEAMGVQYGIEDHEHEINKHKGHIENLKKLERHIDHLEDKLGGPIHEPHIEALQSGGNIVDHRFPAIDKHEMEDHLRKAKYQLVRRDENDSTYNKHLGGEDGNLIVNHKHPNGMTDHSIQVKWAKPFKNNGGTGTPSDPAYPNG